MQVAGYSYNVLTFVILYLFSFFEGHSGRLTLLCYPLKIKYLLLLLLLCFLNVISGMVHSFLYARLETGPYYVIGYGGRAGIHTGFRTITLVLYIRFLSNLTT